jgi:hypothetical protein
VECGMQMQNEKSKRRRSKKKREGIKTDRLSYRVLYRPPVTGEVFQVLKIVRCDMIQRKEY